MCAVKKAVPVDDLIPKTLSNVCGVVIFLRLKVVLVGSNVFRLLLLFFYHLGLSINLALQKGLLLPTKLIIEIDKNICARNLN